MADSNIGSLQRANVIFDSDYFVLEQSGVAKCLTGATLTGYLDRRIVNVSVVQIPASDTGYCTFNKVTGLLTIYIPRGDSLSSITELPNGHAQLNWESGRTQVINLVKGDTGTTAYQYAVQQGYTGSEQQFAQMMLTIYQAGENEATRQENEAFRVDTFTYIQESYAEMQQEFSELAAYQDSYVIDTTLYLFKGGVQATTLFL